MDLKTSISHIAGVGPAYDAVFKKHGIYCVNDLLWNIPYQYIDATSPTPILHCQLDTSVVIRGVVRSVRSYSTARRHIGVVEAICADETGEIPIIWFNQPYIQRTLHEGDSIIVFGKVRYDFSARRKTLTSPLLLKKTALLPVYHESKRLTSVGIRKIVTSVIDQCSPATDPLPPPYLQKYSLMGLWQSLKEVHLPTSNALLVRAQHRLALEELIRVSCQLRLQRPKHSDAPACTLDIPLIKKCIAHLPFTLTSAQKIAAWQIMQDVARSTPMRRLLMGDVGSGKTVVAALVSLVAARSGYQSLWLAPTEVLVGQHVKTLSDIGKPLGLTIGVYTRTNKKADFENNDIIVGTHALLNTAIPYSRVGLVVVDEQHRFGVKQRAHLASLTHPTPHLLSMTATPIPRSLALTLYGDLDISLIAEQPLHRKKIETHIIHHTKREKAYEYIRATIAKGHQAYIVVPRVDLVENIPELLFDTDTKSVKAEYERLKKDVFPNFRIGILHGKLTSKIKLETMEKFKKGLLDICVTTTVIEVGIDVPNATVMMIENAEQFGLAQLHQLRGRVGRSTFQSYCLCISSIDDAQTSRRLTALTTCDNGFELADIDLRLRGPGALTGLQQSGFTMLKLARLSDAPLLHKAREIVDNLIRDGIPDDYKATMTDAPLHGE